MTHRHPTVRISGPAVSESLILTRVRLHHWTTERRLLRILPLGWRKCLRGSTSQVTFHHLCRSPPGLQMMFQGLLIRFQQIQLRCPVPKHRSHRFLLRFLLQLLYLRPIQLHQARPRHQHPLDLVSCRVVACACLPPRAQVISPASWGASGMAVQHRVVSLPMAAAADLQMVQCHHPCHHLIVHLILHR